MGSSKDTKTNHNRQHLHISSCHLQDNNNDSNGSHLFEWFMQNAVIAVGATCGKTLN